VYQNLCDHAYDANIDEMIHEELANIPVDEEANLKR